jgi:hypothetical protein
MAIGVLPLRGDLGLRVIRAAAIPDALSDKIERFNPSSKLGRVVRLCLQHLPDDLALELMDRVQSAVIMESALGIKVLRVNHQDRRLQAVEDWGIVSEKVVSRAGVNYLVDAFQGTVSSTALKYHGMGTSSAAESTANTALTAESTAITGNVRATGSLTEGSTTNIFQTVGTLTCDTAVTIKEHGLFSTSGFGAGTLWDRSIFADVGLSSGDSIQFTYNLTIADAG